MILTRELSALTDGKNKVWMNIGLIVLIIVLMWTAVRINHIAFREIQKNAQDCICASLSALIRG